ncbi:MarR family winged helix-turn-helix transcriptional regulator [Embleya sp. NPDC056575]|uniref:MarR family winged helix-turn-helix transcriptional regulator n=1 Tax=unclassified Embleya TaxID=2699296 RepID=UPI0036AC0133
MTGAGASMEPSTATGQGGGRADGPVASGDVAAIRRGITAVAGRMRASRSADALSSNKVVVLGRLLRHGPCTPGELAAAEHQQPQSLTRVFAELARDGLLTRARDARDGRQSVLTLTPAGRAALVRDAAERDAWLAGAMGSLTETERQVLRLAADLMRRMAGDGANDTEVPPESDK